MCPVGFVLARSEANTRPLSLCRQQIRSHTHPVMSSGTGAHRPRPKIWASLTCPTPPEQKGFQTRLGPLLKNHGRQEESSGRSRNTCRTLGKCNQRRDDCRRFSGHCHWWCYCLTDRVTGRPSGRGCSLEEHSGRASMPSRHQGHER